MVADRAPLFSVIIPTHNRPDYLAEAIESVLAQTVQDFEVIVVDDGSEPPVPEHDDPRVRLTRRQQAVGPSQARNDGASAANGEYLAFLDDDDWFAPDRLQVALDGLERAPVTLCWGGYKGETAKPGLTLDGHVHDRLLDNGYAPTAGVSALRRDCFLPFDPAFKGAEDIDWWLRLTEQHPVSTVPAHCYLVRRHGGVRTEHGPRGRLSGSLLLLEKHKGYFATHRRARAFRWRRIASYQAELGQQRAALFSTLRALAARPDVATVAQLVRTVRATRADSPAVPTAAGLDMGPEESRYYSSQRLDMLPHVPVADSYLDLGCGEGRFAEQLKSRHPAAVVWGVEPSGEAASEAATRIDQVIVGSYPECRNQIDRRFSCIVCNDVLEHMVDPWTALAELVALLEPGGTLVASLPNIRNLATIYRLAVNGRWDYVDSGVLDRTHLRFFTPATMVEMIESAGLQIEAVKGSWPLTTRKMRLLRVGSWFISRGLARDGVFRQYVIVAALPSGVDPDRKEGGTGEAPTVDIGTLRESTVFEDGTTAG
jgi:glycosyltransferase involved in cell wall biosynthesis/2-polyprenyl-3-methyl-5-hydroxy-6-metoxy-1,4-benzoquinol methylase